MTVEYILSQIPEQMKAMGHDRYRIDSRLYTLPPSGKLRLDLPGVYLYVPVDHLGQTPEVKIESDWGLTDLLGGARQVAYQHSGRITFFNGYNRPQPIGVILAIPLNSDTSTLTIAQ